MPSRSSRALGVAGANSSEAGAAGAHFLLPGVVAGRLWRGAGLGGGRLWAACSRNHYSCWPWLDPGRLCLSMRAHTHAHGGILHLKSGQTSCITTTALAKCARPMAGQRQHGQNQMGANYTDAKLQPGATFAQGRFLISLTRSHC